MSAECSIHGSSPSLGCDECAELGRRSAANPESAIGRAAQRLESGIADRRDSSFLRLREVVRRHETTVRRFARLIGYLLVLPIVALIFWLFPVIESHFEDGFTRFLLEALIVVPPFAFIAWVIMNTMPWR